VAFVCDGPRCERERSEDCRGGNFSGFVRRRNGMSAYAVRVRPVALLAVAAIALAACASTAGDDDRVSAPPTSTTTTTRPPVTDQVPASVLKEILDDAAAASRVAVEDLVVVRAESVGWSDGSLGCPQPGFVYTQAVVAGYWVEIDAGGDLLDYRIAYGHFDRCDNP